MTRYSILFSLSPPTEDTRTAQNATAPTSFNASITKKKGGVLGGA